MKPSEQARARELYAQGVSRKAIAEKLSVSRPAVTEWTADMPPPKKECPVCHKQFAPKRTNQRYCSNKCSKQHHYQIWKGKNTPTPPQRQCEACDKSFQPRNGHRHRFCSVQCGNKHRSHRHYQKRKEASDGNNA